MLAVARWLGGHALLKSACCPVGAVLCRLCNSWVSSSSAPVAWRGTARGSTHALVPWSVATDAAPTHTPPHPTPPPHPTLTHLYPPTLVQMRETYGKLMYLLQDSCEEQIVELLEFK